MRIDQGGVGEDRSQTRVLEEPWVCLIRTLNLHINHLPLKAELEESCTAFPGPDFRSWLEYLPARGIWEPRLLQTPESTPANSKYSWGVIVTHFSGRLRAVMGVGWASSTLPMEVAGRKP